MRHLARLTRGVVALGGGVMLLQMGGCGMGDFPFFEIVQTGLLGVTAAGALAILQNI